MKSLFIIITSLVLFTSCTKDVQVVREEKIPEVKTQVINPWPEGKKHMHVTMYFTRMAQQIELSRASITLHLQPA